MLPHFPPHPAASATSHLSSAAPLPSTSLPTHHDLHTHHPLHLYLCLPSPATRYCRRARRAPPQPPAAGDICHTGAHLAAPTWLMAVPLAGMAWPLPLPLASAPPALTRQNSFTPAARHLGCPLPLLLLARRVSITLASRRGGWCRLLAHLRGLCLPALPACLPATTLLLLPSSALLLQRGRRAYWRKRARSARGRRQAGGRHHLPTRKMLCTLRFTPTPPHAAGAASYPHLPRMRARRAGYLSPTFYVLASYRTLTALLRTACLPKHKPPRHYHKPTTFSIATYLACLAPS